ncbi:DUF4386 domain-containing protein [Parasphingorhabdus sp.]|uniref:DUF4386 domain-containing protein n=1 Tax=Parasphingorhabdus sp. TaxID=2709688 RepID=UPI003001B002
MQSMDSYAPQTLGRWVGWSMLATLIIGISSAFLVAEGIDINLSADVEATAQNMLEAEQRLRGKAYIAALTFALDALVSIGLFMLLRKSGQLLAAWSLLLSVTAAILSLLGAIFAMNAAEIAGDPAYQNITNEAQRLMLSGLQATSSYTSFHLGLILSSFAMAGYFFLFLRSSLIPRIIAGWGLFASLFVGVTIVARDFFPMLGHETITGAFMISNIIAIIATGVYLSVWGVRGSSGTPTV